AGIRSCGTHRLGMGGIRLVAWNTRLVKRLQGLPPIVADVALGAVINVRDHALGAKALAEPTYTSEGVEIESTDSGRLEGRSANQPSGAGQGLIGIAQRAALLGDHAEASPMPEEGLRVRAFLSRDLVPG